MLVDNSSVEFFLMMSVGSDQYSMQTPDWRCERYSLPYLTPHSYLKAGKSREEIPMNVFLVEALVFILNLPFGYWRASEQKF